MSNTTLPTDDRLDLLYSFEVAFVNSRVDQRRVPNRRLLLLRAKSPPHFLS